MKLTHIIYIISLFVLASCSTTAIVSNHWANYVNSNSEVTNLISSTNNTLDLQDFKLIEIKENFLNKDSVVIVTKTGKTYKGVVSKSDFDGYFIRIMNNREIYVSNVEIKAIQFIKSPIVTNIQSLSENPRSNSVLSKDKIPIEKADEEAVNNNSLENDVWDNTNSEFEISKSENSPLSPPKNISNKEYAPFSFLSLIFTMLGFLTGFTFILGLVFGAISLSRIKANPEKYKGKRMVKFSFFLSLGFVLFFIAILLLALFILSII